MHRKITRILIAVALTFGVVSLFQFASVSSVNAALFDQAKGEACSGTQLTGAAVNCDSKPQGEKVNSLITRVVNIISVIVGLVAVVMIIVNGLKFITSSGDSNAVSSAKRGLVYAVIGLVIVALAQFIVRFVLNSTKGIT